MREKSNAEQALIRTALLTAPAPVLILSHPFPDGDSIGSTVAVARLLAAAGIKTEPVLAPVAASYAFLTQGLEILSPPIDATNKVVLVLDCSDVARLHEAGHSLVGARQVINIDHHRGNEYFGDLNYVDSAAAAVGEIIHRLFRDYRQYYSAAVAEALFTALMTDTGRFSYANTSSPCLKAAAELVELGAEPQRVYNCLYQNRSRGYLALLAQALPLIELHFSGRVSLLPLSKELLASSGVDDSELEEINDYPRSLAGVEISVVLKESGPNQTKASLRSKACDVAAIARSLGGGGHLNAAGITFALSLTTARQQLLERLGKEDLQ